MKFFTLFVLSFMLLSSTEYDRNAKGDISKFAGAKRLDDKQVQYLKESIKFGRANNVILIIGDGMGDSEITIARNYHVGAGGFLAGLDALPFSGQYTTYSLDKVSGKPDYVTDSAASATAFASGVKTYNGALGVDIFDKKHPTLVQIAKKNGKATGNITTSAIYDATPAAQYAHINSRKCYGPDETIKICQKFSLQNGGDGSIVEQLINSRADITMGGGIDVFAQKVSHEKHQITLLEKAKKDNYQVVTNVNELNKIKSASSKRPVLGLFAEHDMEVNYKGPQAIYHGNVKQIETGKTIQCEIKADPNIPTLEQMTSKSIELLSKNKNGFFLQIEGASIDKQNHKSNPCGQIGETIELDKAIKVALEFAKKDGNTLVIVTADHGHSSQIIHNNVKSTGLTQAIKTNDDTILTVNYGNSEDPEDQKHTGTQVRVAAYGPNSILVTGLIDQTDIFFIIKDTMGLN